MDKTSEPKSEVTTPSWADMPIECKADLYRGCLYCAGYRDAIAAFNAELTKRAEPQAEAAAPSLDAAVPANSPVALAWRTYCASEDFADSFAWAEQNEHRKGSMWAAFTAGFYAERERHAEDAAIAAIVREPSEEQAYRISQSIGPSWNTSTREYSEMHGRRACKAVLAAARKASER